MEELVDQFDVRTEAGEVFRLYVYEAIIEAGTFQNPNATIRGLKRIVTEDGDPVNVVDEQTYHLVLRRENATRV